MNAPAPLSVSFATKILLFAAVTAAVTGIAFGAWIDHGAAIFMSMAETGLSWCF